MNSEQLESIKSKYKAGRAAFERGQYRQAVTYLETVSSSIDRNSSFGGEAQIWLVTAYEAAGLDQKAIALCQKLTRHTHIETRKQAKRLLCILEAPKLKIHPEWRVEIPDMAALDESGAKFRQVSAAAKPKSPAPKPPKPRPKPVDLSQVNTKDNQFIWVALGAVALILGALLYFNH